MSDLVSILIPAYNAEPWLAESVGSALAQTWPNKEIIVVDDGSTDDTLAVARGFEGPHVRVLTQPNRGAAAARNAALGAARGDYIQWLDADDVLHAQKIANQMRVVATLPPTQALATSSWGRFFSDANRARVKADRLWETLSPVEWISRKFIDNTFMFPASWLAGRHLVDRAGPWDERLSLDDDGEYFCRLVAASSAVHFVPDAWCYYRIGNSSSLSWRKSDRALESAQLSMKLCVDQLLTLEDSPRTRSASCQFLQAAHEQLYPERADLIDECRALAARLGGSIHPPRERMHFLLFRLLLGWRAAKAVRVRMAHYRLAAARLLEPVHRRHPAVIRPR